MAAYFIDSSALVKRYVNEVGTTFVTSITDPAAGHHTYVARITGAEVIAALARRGRAGDVIACCHPSGVHLVWNLRHRWCRPAASTTG